MVGDGGLQFVTTIVAQRSSRIGTQDSPGTDQLGAFLACRRGHATLGEVIEWAAEVRVGPGDVQVQSKGADNAKGAHSHG